jgi:hypothetical protein
MLPCTGHIHGTADAPSAHAPAPLSPELDALVLACLEKAPVERPIMTTLNAKLRAIAARHTA